MKLRIRKKHLASGDTSLGLDGELTVYTVSRIKDFLMKELSESKGFELDLSGINQFDTAGFQLLLFFKRETELSGGKVTIAALSDQVRWIFGLYHETV